MFPSTHWSKVFSAGQPESALGLAALDELLRRYQMALRAHLTFKYRVPEDQAADFLQGFVAERILKKGLLALADPARGKFRTFLLNALDNFFLNEIRNATTQRRAPAQGAISLDELAGIEPAAPVRHPSAAFDEAWALRVMESAQERMELECRASGRSDIWEVFAGRILRPLLEDEPALDYAEIVARFGYRSPDQAANVLITGKRMFIRNLRAVIAEYAKSEEEISAEVEELKQILSRPGAWFGQ